MLTRHFLKLYGEKYGRPSLRLTRRTQAFLLRYSWPGNVPGLESALSYAAMMCDAGTTDLVHLPESFQRAVPSGGSFEREIQPLEVMERR